MTSPDVSPRGFVLFSASVLGWIVVLSYALKFLFGANVSGGWLVVGIMFSILVIGAILMVKDLFTTVEKPLPQKQERLASKTRTQVARLEKPQSLPTAATPAPVRRPTTALAYRTALGLESRSGSANRRRMRLLAARRGTSMADRLRFWLISANLGALLRN